MTTSENKPMREQHGLIKEQHGPVGETQQSKHRFGNYDLVRRIDTGGMGEVYLARQRTAFDREVAIKIIRSDLVHDVIARKRFRREAEVNAHIKHEHILPLYELGEEQGRLFLVTPYIAGGTLARRLYSGPLSLTEVHQLFIALVQAVAYIHRRGVVHRDLKPTNVLLDQEEHTGRVYVRLIDFGIAAIQGMSASPPLTMAGNEMGTVAYMAPERLDGVAAPSNDIYSLGVILYQMLTGHLPTTNYSANIPPPLEYVVSHSIAANPDERFSSAEDLLQAFEYAYQYLMAPEQAASAFNDPAHVVHGGRPQELALRETKGSPGSMSFPFLRSPNGRAKNEVKITHRLDHVTATRVHIQPLEPLDAFDPSDYEAPTVTMNDMSVQSKLATDSIPIPTPSSPVRPSKRRKNPIIAILTVLLICVLLAVAGLFAFRFQSVVTVSAQVHFGPHVQTVKQVSHLKGSSSQQTPDATTASIPVKTLTASQTGSQQGPTSQICFIGCSNVVSTSDVSKLTNQATLAVQKQIQQNFQQQLQSLGATQVGDVQFSEPIPTSDPQLGAQSDTVTVTVAEQAKVAYILNGDAQDVARQLLTRQVQKLGPNYLLTASTIRIGQPVVQSVDDNGVAIIAIASGGIAQYQFPSSQIDTIQKHIKGLKLQDAIASIKKEPGVDASTVFIRLSTGTIMPSDTEQINMLPINPNKLPSLQLPAVTP